MEIREKNNIYAVPLIGGILCLITFFVSDWPYGFHSSFNTIIIITFLISFVLEVICANIMIYSAIMIKVGKTTLSGQKKKLMIFSWLVIGVTLILSFLFIFIQGRFILINRYGLTGCLITLMGIYYYEHKVELGHKFAYTVETKGEKVEPTLGKDKVFHTYPKFCTNCGFNLKEGQFTFCPECGNQLTPK